MPRALMKARLRDRRPSLVMQSLAFCGRRSCDELPGAAIEVGHDGLALGVEAEAGLAPLIGRVSLAGMAAMAV